MTKSTKRNFSETLNLLIAHDRSVPLRKGKPNIAALARDIDVHQPTLKRWLEEGSKDPTKDNAEKLCKRFHVSRDQLVGKDPIPWIDGGHTREGAKLYSIASPTLKETIADLNGQSEALQDLFISVYWSMKRAYERLGVGYISGEIYDDADDSSAPPRSDRK